MTRTAQISAYPDVDAYEWYYVTRNEDEWSRDYWRQCCRRHCLFMWSLGMRYQDFDADWRVLHSPASLRYTVPPPGVNRWIPESFPDAFGAALREGRSFYDYCIQTIVDRTATPIALDDLDSFLLSLKRSPLYLNTRANHEI